MGGNTQETSLSVVAVFTRRIARPMRTAANRLVGRYMLYVNMAAMWPRWRRGRAGTPEQLREALKSRRVRDVEVLAPEPGETVS
jgi:hypothetical protein